MFVTEDKNHKPARHDRRRGEDAGGRNTSPCTSFQPYSSWASSSVCMLLYVLISCLKVRKIIIPTTPVRNNTIIKLLTIEK